MVFDINQNIFLAENVRLVTCKPFSGAPAESQKFFLLKFQIKF